MRSLSPVPFTHVAIQGKFWRERVDTVLSRTIPSQYEKLQEQGILESLDVEQPPPPLRIPPGQHGLSMQVFWDSDVGKWIEAASYSLGHQRDVTIEAKIDEITEQLERAQLPDGYLNCWFIGRHPDQRWTNLRDWHELYCAGHLIEGAIAYWQATGRSRLLGILCRYVDHIATVFGPGTQQKHGYCGHQEIELALVKLYHATGTRKYLDLAAYFVDERGKKPHYFDIEALARGESPEKYVFKNYEYNQSHRKVREQDKVVGHAVRAMYMYSAMADLATELGDATLKTACETLWEDVTSKRMYVTAGIGPSASNEGFTQDYDLPNETAYAETCASIALIFWAHRMLHLEGSGRYADVMETALFNGALSGLSRDGVHYFYSNPLASDGSHARWKWHPCPCCTMNVSRLVASIGGYFYSSGGDAVAVHLYGASSVSLTISGEPVRILQTTDYPWSGQVELTIDVGEPLSFVLRLRIPGWTSGASLAINDTVVDVSAIDGYAEIERSWKKGDVVKLDFPMPAERVYAHPLVEADVGRVSLRRGPLVYCIEQADHPDAAVGLIRVPPAADLRVEPQDDLLGGIVTVVADAEACSGVDPLYSTERPKSKPIRLTAIPYYLWNNRGPNSMQVWIPTT